MKPKDIVDAWARIRTIDQSIPDEVLDFMKDAAIEMLREDPAKEIAELKARVAELNERLIAGRHYLMGVSPDKITVEDALQELGYGRNGLR